jgi:hypothetical protein
MSRLDRRACVTLAWIALGSLGGLASIDARGENPPERHEHRPSEGERQGRRTHPLRAQSVHPAVRRDPSHVREYPLANNHREMLGRSESQLAGSGRAISHGLAGQARVVRYGNALSGTVERTIRPGFVSRTFVSGGHVLYTHVYQRHVWHQFGRAFAYDRFVPAVRYPAGYYAWALAAWPHPVTYSWGWQAQPWYPMYGSRFTPYPVYVSPDLWMTDYIIAQSMQTAYQSQTAAPGWEPSTQGAPADPVAESSGAAPAAEPADAAPTAQPSDAAPGRQSGDTPSPSAPAAPSAAAPAAMPPTVTPQIKAQLDAQIKVQLQEQQAAAATPVALTTQSTPPALRPNHVFFQVVQRLEVPSGTANHYCSLSADDYIKRTGGISADDWTIPVVVELSGPSDCPSGLHTRIGLNDLNAMENEQEAQVMEAMQAASKSMGPNGPPSGPGPQPTLIAAGNAAPDQGALEALRQAQ